MTITERIAANINRNTADQASHFAYSFGLPPDVERHLHNLLKDACLYGLDQGVVLSKHFYEQEPNQ